MHVQSHLTNHVLRPCTREWVNGHGTPLESFNPATEELITAVHTADADDIEFAVKAAREAFETTWGLNVAGAERGRLLYKFADVSSLLIDMCTQRLMTIENGV